MSDLRNAQESSRVEPLWDRNRPARDDASPAGTSGGFRGISGVDRLFYGAVAAISLGIGVVNAFSQAQDAAWRGGVYDLRTTLLGELSSIVVIIAVAPVLFVAVRRMRHVSRWPLRVGLAVAAIVAFSGLHIVGMVGLRKLAMFLAGGAYDFHLSAATLLYEFRKDVMTCVLIGGALWLIDSRRETRQARSDVTIPLADAASAAPEMIWLRDGSARIRIEPHDILTIGFSGKRCGILHGRRPHPPRARNAGRRGSPADKIQHRTGAPDAAGQPFAGDRAQVRFERRFRADARHRPNHRRQPPLSRRRRFD